MIKQLIGNMIEIAAYRAWYTCRLAGYDYINVMAHLQRAGVRV